MEIQPVPVAEPAASLVDVLDHLLTKGLVVDAELVITLADVPLLALHLGAFLAAVDTVERHLPSPTRVIPERGCPPSSVHP